MAELKPAYLIAGDDVIKIDAWRRRLRSRADAEGPAASLEAVADERLSAEAAAEAISALTLAVGRRYVLLDGAERWSERDVRKLEPVLAALPPDTVVVFLARGKAPKGLGAAVERCGGEVHAYAAPRPAALPGWLRERARELGLELDPDAAETLIQRLGSNQRRLVRELEKLALFVGSEDRIGNDAVERLTTPAVEARAYELADAVIEGERARAVRIAEELRARGEDLMHILFALLRQLRSCHRCWAMIASGKSAKDVQSELRVPPFVARRLVTQARRADGEQLERALDLLADLDYAIRGAGRLDADSALTLAIARAASRRRAAA